MYAYACSSYVCRSKGLPLTMSEAQNYSRFRAKIAKKNLQKEVDHLARVLKQNGYPANFIGNTSAPPTQETADTSNLDMGQKEEKGPLVVIPNVAGMSEDISNVCRKFNIRVVLSPGRLSAQC